MRGTIEKSQNYLAKIGIRDCNTEVLLNSVVNKSKAVKDLFGDKMMLIYDVNMEVKEDMETIPLAVNKEALLKTLVRLFFALAEREGVTMEEGLELEYTSSNFIKTNRFIKSHSVSFDGKEVDMPSGSRMMKGLSKIADTVKSKDLNSTYVQIDKMITANNSFKKVKGKLVLSILPLDFLTVSSDSFGWTSCVAPGGDYFIGASALLQSKDSIVAYYVRESDWHENYHSVPLKKSWRRVVTLNNNGGILLGVEYPRKISLLSDRLKEILVDKDHIASEDFSTVVGLYYNDFKKASHMESFSLLSNLEKDQDYQDFYNVGVGVYELRCLCCGRPIIMPTLSSVVCKACETVDIF